VYRIPTHGLALLPPSPLRERPAEPADDDAIKRAYLRFAAARNGMLARPAFVWSARLAPHAERRRYVVQRGSDVTAYLSYTCHRRRERWGYRLVVDDFAALDWESELALWQHLAGHRAQSDDVTGMGLPVDALALHLPEQRIEMVYPNRWMLRLVDVAGAIAARGFPPALRAEVPLAIGDPRVPANDGDWMLEVDGGRGALTRRANTAGSAASITINALAPLFSAGASARVLAAAGLVAGATPDQLATLDTIFAGPAPAMNDIF
jgi:predicted acetyltransferase